MTAPAIIWDQRRTPSADSKKDLKCILYLALSRLSISELTAATFAGNCDAELIEFESTLFSLKFLCEITVLAA